LYYKATQSIINQKDEGFSKILKKGNIDNVYVFCNKQPRWDAVRETYVLNFHGRVNSPSVKNFQIVENNESYI